MWCHPVFYSLDVVSKNIGIDLPFGLRLMLNPVDDEDPSISAFPNSVQYEWGGTGLLKVF